LAITWAVDGLRVVMFAVYLAAHHLTAAEQVLVVFTTCGPSAVVVLKVEQRHAPVLAVIDAHTSDLVNWRRSTGQIDTDADR
jgi:hypothetical protein